MSNLETTSSIVMLLSVFLLCVACASLLIVVWCRREAAVLDGIAAAFGQRAAANHLRILTEEDRRADRQGASDVG